MNATQPPENFSETASKPMFYTFDRPSCKALPHGTCALENHNGLVVDASLTTATGTAECDAAIAVVEELPGNGCITLSMDKGYDAQDFSCERWRLGVTPHVTQNTKERRHVIDGRTTLHTGYATSLRIHKHVERRCSLDNEEVFGWIKTVGVLRKPCHRGTARVGWMFTFVAAASTSCVCPSRWLIQRSHARTLSGAIISPRPSSETRRNTCP